MEKRYSKPDASRGFSKTIIILITFVYVYLFFYNLVKFSIISFVVSINFVCIKNILFIIAEVAVVTIFIL